MISRTILDHGAVDQLPGVVHDLGAERVLLVCGRRSFEASGAARVLPALERIATVTRFSDIRPNTDARDLAAGLEVLARTDPDLVLGIGGGSPMDLAKLLVAYDGLDPAALPGAIRSGERIEERRRNLVLVPTTSGSGAEATHFAVVYLDEVKHSIAGPALHADAVVLDPQLSLSGTPHQRATSGVDAVAQAIESLWATDADEGSRSLADEALSLLLPALVPYVTSPSPDPGLARDVTDGAHRAGRAIDISRTTAAHALSYGLTKGYGLPHGHAVGVTLGAFVAAHAEVTDDRLQPGVDPQRHHRLMASILHHLGAVDGVEGHHRVDALLEAVGLAPGLVANGVVGAEARAALASGVNAERLGNNPVAFTTAELEELLARCG